jgi:hypothetical protein
MATLSVSKVVGGLLFLTAILGLVIVGLDSVLRAYAPTHYYALIFFVIVDIAVGILVIVKPTRSVYSAVVIWSLIRIILQLADVSQSAVYQFSSYGQFADYLFNPASAVSASFGNPPGIPGLPIDFILILEILALVPAWKQRKLVQSFGLTTTLRPTV